MTPQTQGRFCERCQCVVRDFTQRSQTEMLTDVQASDRAICGRVRRAQLAPSWRVMPLVTVPHRRRWTKWVVAGLAALGMVQHQGYAQTDADSSRAEIRSSQHIGLFSGTVYGRVEKQPLQHALVVLLHGNEPLVGATTDSLGHFSLQLPPDAKIKYPLTLKIRYLQTVFVAEDLSPQGANLRIELNEAVWMEDITVFGSQSASPDEVMIGLIVIDATDTGYRTVPLRIPGLWGYDDLNDWIFMHHSEVKRSRF